MNIVSRVLQSDWQDTAKPLSTPFTGHRGRPVLECPLVATGSIVQTPT